MSGADGLSDELRALATRIDASYPQPPREILGPVTAIRELGASALSILAGRGASSSDDRISLRADVANAIASLGEDVTKTTDVSVRDLRTELNRLPQLLAEANGARVVEGLAQAVLAELAQSEVILAAWNDVLDAFSNGQRASICELRIAQLGELVDLRGGDWSDVRRRLARVLLDDRIGLAEVGVTPFPAPDEAAAPAGLSIDERLDACCKLLSRDPERGELVVWLGFTNAMLRDGYLSLGHVEFFGDEAWPDGVRSGWPQAGDRREEFSEDDFPLFLAETPDPPFVLARVRLDTALIGESVRRARLLATDLVRAASPATEWRIMDGAAVYVHGEHPGWFGSFLQVDRPLPTERFTPEFEPTADRLAELDPSLVERLLAEDQGVRSAIRDIRWLERVASLGDDAQQIALGVRLIERHLPKGRDEHWSAAATRYLKDVWCQAEMHGFIADVAHNAVAVLEHPMPVVGLHQPWRARLLPPGGPATYSVALAETLHAVGELDEAVPRDSLQGRTVSELRERTSDASAVVSWKGELAVAFDRLLARAARQRNAVLHGADTVDEVLSSVVPFVGWLQARVSREALDAVTNTQSLAARLELARARARRRWCALDAGAPPLDALFDPPSADSDGS